MFALVNTITKSDVDLLRTVSCNRNGQLPPFTLACLELDLMPDELRVTDV